MKLNRKKKIVFLLLIDAILLAIVFLMILYRPGLYNPVAPIEGKEVSPYLTHYLLAQIHNGVESDEPFEVVIEQAGINDIVARANWPKESNGILLSDPAVVFKPGEMILMCLANVKGIRLVVSIVITPGFDEDGRLYLRISKLRVGAMNLALIARPIARRMYLSRAAELGYDSEDKDISVQLAEALLAGESFEPVIDLNSKKVRLSRVSVEEGRLIVEFIPVF